MSFPEEEESSSSSLETVSEAYKTLVTKLATISHLQRTNGLLNYDQMVSMPAKAAPERGAQMSAMAEIVHEKATDPQLLDLIEQAQKDLVAARRNKKQRDDNNNTPVTGDPLLLYKDEERLLELERKDFVENARIPKELVSKRAALKAAANVAWAKARQENDFASFQPLLEQCFDLTKEVAEAKMGDKQIPHYTQMLDAFEMGMAPERLDAIFDQIQAALVPLIAKIWSDAATPPSTKPLTANGPYDETKQVELCRKIVTQLGYDLDCGRIDKAVHPFTLSVSPSDVRITSRTKPDEWHPGVAATIHESGHAMYEQNLPKPKTHASATTTPLQIDAALSLGMHESQSLFWERHVGLSRPFWKWATPLLEEAFPKFNHKPEEVYKAVNAVRKSLIRVEADELAYPLHVILRYRIEREVISGKLEVADIPQSWNEQMKKLLGIENIPSDSVGCLQDIHWSMMAIGYFPTYLLGSSTAAQLAHYCKLDIPDMDELMENGEFTKIKTWLIEKVHRHGKRYSSLDALLEAQLGEPLNPKYFIDYLTQKYSEIYLC